MRTRSFVLDAWWAVTTMAASAVPVPTRTPPPELPYMASVEWSFVAFIVAFGGAGSIARILNSVPPEEPLRRHHGGQALAGCLAAMVVSYLLADVIWFLEHPRALIGLMPLAGWSGATALDFLSRRALLIAERMSRVP